MSHDQKKQAIIAGLKQGAGIALKSTVTVAKIVIPVVVATYVFVGYNMMDDYNKGKLIYKEEE